MKYENFKLKNTQGIVLEPKRRQSSDVTLTFDLLTPKSLGVLFRPVFIFYQKWKLYFNVYTRYRVRTKALK